MLDQYRHTGRNLRRNLIVTFLFGAITIVFVFWGLNPRKLGMSTVGAIAEVNGELISISDFQNEVNRLSEMYSQFLGQMNSDAKSKILRGEAVKNLVQMELVSQGSKDQGILVSDDEVRDQVVSLPFLQKDGQFQREYYEGYVSHLRTTPQAFEHKVRKILANQKIERLFEQAFTPAKLESEKTKTLEQTRLNLQVLKFSKDELQKKLTITDTPAKAMVGNGKNTAIESYYNSHKASFKAKDGSVKPLKDVEIEIAKTILAEELAGGKVKELEGLLEKGDVKAVDAWVVQNKLKWEETGEFNLNAARIPKVGESESAMKLAYGLSTKMPLAKTLVQEGDTKYALKLKDRAVAAANSKAASDNLEMMAMQKSREALTLWLEKVRSKANVQENLALLNQGE